jgi:hypothetical protein
MNKAVVALKRTDLEKYRDRKKNRVGADQTFQLATREISITDISLKS